MLLTQRAADLRAHSGQVAFPGGKIDPGETPAAKPRCARRRRRSGSKRASSSRSAGSTPISPAPAIASRRWWRWSIRRSSLTLNPDEVDEAFETPLAFLMDAANHQLDRARMAGRKSGVSTPCRTKGAISGARPPACLRNLYERLFSLMSARDPRAARAVPPALCGLCHLSCPARALSARDRALDARARLRC